eukprot:CAMPEP_0197241320 /NCGR_PEP_ID=MMETSP1429-20130617/7387_1 /TAXON_ID=49237 /ORGANISM="Chaetoceros  sp., Strain UNC1202" /LENGTH=50 /DNA_ID=CAMNT_0042701135 /DNA_START=26 /DNA_END=174 /DNA_ORIENTATION=-
MERRRRRKDRFRPEFALGGTDDGLSVPQQELKREQVAVQKHQPMPAKATA